MSFSDLVHAVEKDLGGVVGKVEKLLPAGLPSDTREVAALAEDAAHVAVTLDPELEPIFQAIGSVGNTIEGALAELGTHIGTLKVKLAQRAAAPVSVPGVPAGAAPVGIPDPGAPQPAAGPQPSTTDLQAAADQAALARQAQVPPPAPVPEATDPNPLPPAATAPAPDAAPPTEATPSPAPVPGTADPAGANPPEPEVPAAETPAASALADAEADFASLSPEDRAAFEAAEGLEPIPPTATGVDATTPSSAPEQPAAPPADAASPPA
jgi:hypothetical protein